MNFPIQINANRIGLSIIYFKWVIGRNFKKNYLLKSLNIVCILANSAGPDEMPRFAAFHLGLHCLPKYPFRGFQYTKC